MVITCDISCSMGYIYVKPPYDYFDINSESNVNKYYKDIKLEIPVLEDNHFGLALEKLRLNDKTYAQALEDMEIDEEYCNDMDDDGYLAGIELNLRAEKFLQLIEGKAYKVIDTIWMNNEFHIITFDFTDEILNENNIIYPLAGSNNTYLVVSVMNEYKIGLIKAIITNRDDTYPIDYLKKPQFMLLGIK